MYYYIHHFIFFSYKIFLLETFKSFSSAATIIIKGITSVDGTVALHEIMDCEMMLFASYFQTATSSEKDFDYLTFFMRRVKMQCIQFNEYYLLIMA